MLTSRAEITTEHASRYLQQLCKHWSHKFAVEFTAEHGTIPLPMGAATLDANADALRVKVEAEDEPSVERLESVVADHIKRFAFREDLTFVWQRASA